MGAEAVELKRGHARLTEEVTPADVLSGTGTVWQRMYRSRTGEDPSETWRNMLADTAMDRYRDMEEKDGFYAGVLETRKEGVLSKPRRVLAASEAASDERIADAVRDVLEEMRDCENVFYELLDALGKGVSIAEIMWAPEGREIRPIELRFRPQEWFAFGRDFGPQTGELRLSRTRAGSAFPAGAGFDDSGEPLPSNKFVVHSFRPHLGNRWGRPLARRCFWPVWFKQQDIKFWLKFIEKGTGTVLTKFNPGASEDEKAAALKAAEHINDETAVAAPANFPVEVLQNARAGNSSIYRDLVERFANREVAFVVLGQVLTSAGSDGGSGSRSLGEVHNEVRGEKIEVDAKSLMRVVNEQLIRPFVTLNYGPNVEAPRWVIDYEDAEDLGALSERDERLVRTGVSIPTSYFYERYQLPEPEDEEAVVSGGGAPAEFAEGFDRGDREPQVVADAGVEQAQELYDAWISQVIAEAIKDVPE